MNTINRMFRINARIVGLVLALLSSCWSSQAKHPEATAQAVAYCDLIKDAQSFSGKRIRVRAIYKYGFEIQRLDPPLCCPNRGLKIWVEIGEHLPNSSEKRFRKLPKGMGLALVTFVGTFESGGPFGDGGYHFKLTVDEIESLEVTAKPSPSHDPTWLPQNCEESDPVPAK